MVIDLAQRLRSKFVPGTARGSLASHADVEARRQRELIAVEFDPVYYSLRYPDVTGCALDHFVAVGWRERRDPAPWFSIDFYLETYPDVAAAGVNPFFHYLEHGRQEARAIAPADPPANDRGWEIDAIQSAIDEQFYAEQLRAIGVDRENVHMAVHYWREGARLGLDPTPEFSTAHYLSDHPDVAEAGVNPFAHYLLEGKKEGRGSRPAQARHVQTQENAQPPSDEEPKREAKHRSTPRRSKDHDRELAETAFDRDYYLAANPDVAAAGVDPLDHFLGTGWGEGRDPSLSFSVSHYLDFYPDVAAAGINPFLHYLMAGKSEGRLPRHDLGFRYDVITSLKPLSERVEHARTSAPRRKLSDASRLRDALAAAKRVESAGLYISVSHDDFTENFGGVQLVLMRESTAVDAKGFDHLHLFPATPLQIVELETTDPVIGVLLNRERVGFFRASDVARQLASVAPRLATRPFVIHSLIGHSADGLIAILHAAGCASGWYWVHDYSSVCAGYTLLRNDVEFCGGPPPTSSACSICVYGGLRPRQMEAHAKLFAEFDLTVLAPSDAALDVWKSSVSIAAPAKVHEHLRLSTASKRAGRKSEPRSDRPLRVAYIGQPVTHKGWPVFRELAVTFAEDPRYQFYHIGKHPQGIPATFQEVVVGSDDLDRMVRALRDLDIDVVLQWSLWPETFCIAAVEAFRAGAAVLTFKDSGNVAAMVKGKGFGAVLDSEDELMRLFETGEAIEIAARARPSGLTAKFSNMTADFVEEAAR